MPRFMGHTNQAELAPLKAAVTQPRVKVCVEFQIKQKTKDLSRRHVLPRTPGREAVNSILLGRVIFISVPLPGRGTFGRRLCFYPPDLLIVSLSRASNRSLHNGTAVLSPVRRITVAFWKRLLSIAHIPFCTRNCYAPSTSWSVRTRLEIRAIFLITNEYV